MPQRTEKTDYVGYAKRLYDLSARLKAEGYEVDSSRLKTYERIFATNELLIGQNRSSELERRIPFPAFLNAFHESNEFLEACDEFADLSTPRLRNRLQMAL